MKRTPKSFDVTLRQEPKHFVLTSSQEEEEYYYHQINNYHHQQQQNNHHQQQEEEEAEEIIERKMEEEEEEGDLSINMNRLQVSESKQQQQHKSKSSSKKKKKKHNRRSKQGGEDALILPEIISLQEDEEQQYTRCLDSGVVQVNFTSFHCAKDNEQKPFITFRMEVITITQAWVIWRRYSDFVLLASKLDSLSPSNFPPKTPFGGNFAPEFLLKRQGLLSVWFERALQTPGVATCTEMRTFLVNEANCTPISLQQQANNNKSSSASSSSASSARSTTSNVQQQSSSQDLAPSSDLKITYTDTSPRTPQKKDFKLDDQEEEITYPPPSSASQALRKVGLEDFEFLQVLGKGSFGKVILVSKKSGRDAGNLYAMKILNKQNVVIKKQVEHTLTERSVLGKMIHPFIVKLHYAFQTENKLHFVLDYCAGGELFYHLGQAGKFMEDQARFYAAELTLALGHLHSHGVVYRDLKPENILLEASGHLKLADFGLSKEGVESTQGSHSFCGTPEYLAPEVLNRSGHGTAVDWWSLGALLYEMLTGLPPWFNQDRQKLFLGIRHSPLKFPSDLSMLSQTILSDFLKRDPVQRLGSEGVEQVKKHPFFHTIDWRALYELRVPPPLIPTLGGLRDTSNFDANFTRLPLFSDPSSPIHSAANVYQQQQQQQQHLLQQQQLQQQQQSQVQTNVASSGPQKVDALFGGFTFTEDGFCVTPPAPLTGRCTPPPLPFSAQKRSSPMRPTLTNMYHAKPSSSMSSSVSSKTNFISSNSSPTVTG